ncbi:MAG: exo-beta-N-acetylmuramidase NamZ domain-containing protein, partial [Flammeovirgaceae bacterium]
MIGSSIHRTITTSCAATPSKTGGIGLPTSTKAVTAEKAAPSDAKPHYAIPPLGNLLGCTDGRTTAIVILLSSYFFFCLLSFCSLAQPITGAQQLNLLLPKLKSQRVALLVNHTSIVGKTHLVDTLLQSGITIQKIFAPEHGFRGNADAGETIKDGIDSKTQLPVISLYGNNKKPTAQQLSDVDVVIFDIQDVGARFYTYIGSMHYLMQGCAEEKKKLIILDRPNPNGSYIDGPVLDMSLQSFVGMHPVPITHGMTVGEYAQMINGQGWLEGKIKCEIEVVKMKNYTHQTAYSLPIKPSPNMPYDQTVALYPSTCLFEGTVLSVGRGTQHPFEWIGHPDLKNQPFQFTPISIEGMSKNPPHENKVCYGINLEKEKVKKEVSLKHLIDLYHQFPNKEKFFIPFFDKLVGNKTVREQIKKGMTESQIKATWKKELEQYKG